MKQQRVIVGLKTQAGQGVVEYAGALVIAAVIVAAGLQFLPEPFAVFFQSISANALNLILTYVPK